MSTDGIAHSRETRLYTLVINSYEFGCSSTYVLVDERCTVSTFKGSAPRHADMYRFHRKLELGGMF